MTFIMQAWQKEKTKKQKARTAKKRRIVGPKTHTQKDRSIDYGYEPLLIRKDLVKTVLISLLILGLELVLFFSLSG